MKFAQFFFDTAMRATPKCAAGEMWPAGQGLRTADLRPLVAWLRGAWRVQRRRSWVRTLTRAGLQTAGAPGQVRFRGDVSCQTHFFRGCGVGEGGGGGGVAKLHLVGPLLVVGPSLPCPASGPELAYAAECALSI